MKSGNFNLRGVPEGVMALLKQESKQQGVSVNVLILQLIEKGVGYAHKRERHTYHDLDTLAGTWTDSDSKQFAKCMQDFEKIDKDLW